MIFRHLLNMRSHPTWVRGWKQSSKVQSACCHPSHPTWVRGLKLVFVKDGLCVVGSHPTWVRGLKRYVQARNGQEKPSRTLRGCVD